MDQVNTTNSQLQKELPNQNFVEVKFSKTNLVDLSKEEALMKYKKNNYIIGRIFSSDVDKDEPSPERKSDLNDVLNEERVKKFGEDFENMKKKHIEKREEFERRCKQFHIYMEEARNIRTDEDENEFIELLKRQNLYANDYPFFCENSPFHMYTDDSIIKVVNNEQRKSKVWENNENIALFQL